MLNVGLLKDRLGQYGAAWLTSFLLVMFGDLALTLVRVPVVRAADIFLLIALVALAVGFAVFVAVTALSRQNAVTKIALIGLGLVLLLPLLWAPMLGAVASAFIGQVSIEYSSVYAGFRIIVGRLIWFVMRLFTDNPYVEAGLAVLQALATVVGFLASLAQLWRMFVSPPEREEREKRAAEG
jgi:hypothetical protein